MMLALQACLLLDVKSIHLHQPPLIFFLPNTNQNFPYSCCIAGLFGDEQFMVIVITHNLVSAENDAWFRILKQVNIKILKVFSPGFLVDLISSIISPFVSIVITSSA